MDVQDDEGGGVVAMLEPVDIQRSLEVRAFGRNGNAIQLLVVVHPSGGVLPESVKDQIRSTLKRDPRTPVTFDDARATKLATKCVFISGGFPENLPVGTYRVVVEVQEESGKVINRFEKNFVRREKSPDPLTKLTDVVLLAEYVKRGEALKGSGIEPIDFRFGKLAALFPYESPAHKSWVSPHEEIVRRGGQIVPALMAMLEAEAVRNPGEADHMSAKFGFAFDVMDMLERINDPRPMTLLIRVMKGMDGKANLPVRGKAVQTAASLTYVTFLIDSNNPARAYAMMGKGAVVISSEDRQLDPDATLKSVAKLYEAWLADEGKDPSQWLALARQRARAALEGNDPISIRNALAFLIYRYGVSTHDDAPAQTMGALAKLMQRGDQSLSKELEKWINLPSLWAGFGPPARPYVQSMIDRAKEKPWWDSFEDLANVGGEPAMAHMIMTLPQVRDSVERLGISLDVDVEHMSDMNSRNAVLAYRACRWGIERWAGRTFETDAEIAAWWETAKHKTQRAWLEENLDRTAAEADQGSARAQYIIRQILADLPHAADDRPFDPPWRWRETMTYREEGPGPFRRQWLAVVRPMLEYDEERSCFALPR